MNKRYPVVLFLVLAFNFQVKAQNIYVSFDSTAVPEVDLDEVVVNASRDNSKLKQLPVSVSTINASSIALNEINTLNQVSGIIPNFFMPEYGSKLTSPVYIRGIGSRINNPSVGMYVDQVPYFEKASFNFDFFDIERIEVLRGPQGTLFGRNSMGGLINIITRSPLTYQGTNINLSAATYGCYHINAGHYAKINDDLALSLTANYQHNNGFYTNSFFDEQVDIMDSYGFRGKLIYKISDQLSIENIASFEQSKQGGYPYALYNDSLQMAEDINYNQKSSYDRKMFADAVKLKYSGKNWELTNTLSYQYLDDAQKIDQDFTPDSLYFVRQFQNQHMVSDEVIVRSTGNSRLNWLFGAFGFRQSTNSKVDVDAYTTQLWYLKTYDSDVKGFALFNQTSYKVTENLTFTGGLRFDSEISGMKYQYEAIRRGVELPKIDTIYPNLQDHILLPKVAVSYHLNRSNIYASYTTGYKPGGFNTTFERPEHLMFKNETSHNFETGIKTSLFRGYIFTDFALFYTSLKNQQIYRTVPSGRGSYLDNSGLSENKGAEISLKNSPVRGFEAMLAYGYTHSMILEYVQDTTTNYNNKFTPYIPRHTFTVQLTKTVDTKNMLFLDKVRFHVIYNQNGELYWDLDNSYKEDRYGLLNAKISFIRKQVELDIWCRNMLNTEYRSFLFEALSNTYVQMGKPFNIGMNLSINF